MKKRLFILSILLILVCTSFIGGYVFSEKQETIKRMLVFDEKRPSGAMEIDIDNQSAYFKKSSKENQPLIVSLHSWSGDYTQADALSEYVSDLDWNYIRPDFQGRNNHPKSCGSELVISDIDVAIDYAMEKGNVDKSKIFVVGESGGGYATLVSFMNSTHDINTFMSWVPITDLEAWYLESVGRNQAYAEDILACTNSDGELNVDEARKRSPLYMETPKEKLKNSKVMLFTGIHDGYDGSVPITHAINFYNKLAKEHDEDTIEKPEIIDLLGKRTSEKSLGDIQGRDIHLKQSFGNVEITIFEGGHELLEEYTIDILKELSEVE